MDSLWSLYYFIFKELYDYLFMYLVTSFYKFLLLHVSYKLVSGHFVRKILRHRFPNVFQLNKIQSYLFGENLLLFAVEHQAESKKCNEIVLRLQNRLLSGVANFAKDISNMVWQSDKPVLLKYLLHNFSMNFLQ
jgi:hypothetical protein